jgi:hypothetical protein
MTPDCAAPVPDDDLLDFWVAAIDATDAERIEEHLFSCAACTARLEAMASLGAGLVELVRRGKISGIVSRSLLNRMQRDGVQVRLFSLSPGERVPCAAFPNDDLLVVSLRADFAALESVTLSVTGPDDAVIGHVPEVPVSRADREILWATPGEVVRRMASTRLHLTLTSDGPGAAVLGEYELDHTALPPADQPPS